MKKLINLLLIIPLFGFSQWSYKTYKDDFTDELVSYVRYSDELHDIEFNYQGESNSLWMFITIKDFETFEPNSNVEYRIDDYKLRDFNYNNYLKISKLFKEKRYNWEPKTIGFIVWHGIEEEGYGVVGELLSGKKFRIRYYLNSVDRRTINIDLNGSKETIIKGLNLKKYTSSKI